MSGLWLFGIWLSGVFVGIALSVTFVAITHETSIKE